MTIEHHEAAVRVGDALLLGLDLDSATVYVVHANRRVSVTTYCAELVRHDAVTVGGETHYFNERTG